MTKTVFYQIYDFRDWAQECVIYPTFNIFWLSQYHHYKLYNKNKIDAKKKHSIIFLHLFKLIGFTK